VFCSKFFCVGSCSRLKKLIVNSLIMIAFDHEFPIPWNDDDDRDDSLSEMSEHWSSAVSTTIAPPLNAEERISTAAISAWSHSRHSTGIVLGGVAYDVLKDLYFRLRRQLYQHGKRTTFTKEECAVLLFILSSEAMPARGRRQPAQQLNTHLKAVLAEIPSFSLAELQEAAKKCATMVQNSANCDV
jgi:hypothetical protein